MRPILSALELAWAKSGQCALVPKRALEYDAVSLVFYAPSSYDAVEISHSELPPLTQEWISENFNQLVLGDLGTWASRGSPPPCPQKTDIGATSLVSDSIVDEYQAQCEEEYVYSGLIDNVIRDTSLSIEEKVFQIISHPLLGNKENKKYLVPSIFSKIMASASDGKIPLQFMVPAFPFKDQNPFRTSSTADHIDLGEIALLIRLHVLMLGLVQVYPFGAEWIIISDGVPYSTIFDIPPNLVRAYQERLREYRNRLNLQATVHIINMADMTSRFKGFEDTYQSIRNQLENLLRYGKLEKKFAILTRGMAWNMNTKPFLEQHDWCDLWEVLNSEQPPQESRLAELYKEVNRQARQIAIKYASFNLSMKYLGLMNKFFPFAIRATVHPKQGQVAIPQLGEIYPWNGTVLLRRNVKTVGSIESMPLYKILRKADLSPKFLPGSNAPFYYE